MEVALTGATEPGRRSRLPRQWHWTFREAKGLTGAALGLSLSVVSKGKLFRPSRGCHHALAHGRRKGVGTGQASEVILQQANLPLDCFCPVGLFLNQLQHFASLFITGQRRHNLQKSLGMQFNHCSLGFQSGDYALNLFFMGLSARLLCEWNYRPLDGMTLYPGLRLMCRKELFVSLRPRPVSCDTRIHRQEWHRRSAGIQP